MQSSKYVPLRRMLKKVFYTWCKNIIMFINMPRSNLKKRKSYGRRQPASRKSIREAWKLRNRRKTGGLNNRTTQANYKAIKQIKKSIETKMIENTVCVAPNYGGQAFVELLPSTGLVQRLFCGIQRGDLSDERNGNWIQMKNLTLKTKVEPEAGALPATTTRVSFYLVLDRNPMENDNTTVNAATLAMLLAGSSGDNSLLYQNMDNTGLEGRFKVLKHWVQSVSPAPPAVGRYYPPVSYKTVTLKGRYKIKYIERAGINTEPINQNISLFMFSDSAAPPHPRVSCFARVRYKDA